MKGVGKSDLPFIAGLWTVKLKSKDELGSLRDSSPPPFYSNDAHKWHEKFNHTIKDWELAKKWNSMMDFFPSDVINSNTQKTESQYFQDWRGRLNEKLKTRLILTDPHHTE